MAQSVNEYFSFCKGQNIIKNLNKPVNLKQI